jgi:hypothetical protein
MTEDEATTLFGEAADAITSSPVPPTSRLIAGGQRIRRRRQRLLGVGGLAAVASLIVGAGALWFSGSDNSADNLASHTPSATRLVGIGRVVVAVPASWSTNDASCNQPNADTVFFPFPQDCIGLPRPGVSSLAISDVAWREVGFVKEDLHPGRPVDGLHVRESDLSCVVDACSQSVAVPSDHAYFRIQVAGQGAEAVAHAIRDSLRVLPQDRVTVPFDSASRFVGYTGDQASQFLQAHGLNVTVVTVTASDHASGSLVAMDPQPGSVLPSNAVVTLTVAK